MSQLENIIESFEKIFDYYFKITNIRDLIIFSIFRIVTLNLEILIKLLLKKFIKINKDFK